MLIYYPSSVFIRNKYFRWYRSIVENSVERNRNEKYTENHHILPGSIFPEFSDLSKHKWNNAKLTFREHFIAHRLLTKCMIQIYHQMQMVSAIIWFSGNDKINSRQFYIVRKSARLANILRWQDLEYKKSHSLKMKEVSNKPEVRKNKSIAAMKLYEDPNFRRMKIDSLNKPEVKAKIRQKAKEQWRDPQFLAENTFHCDICDRNIRGKTQWKQHLSSKKHGEELRSRSCDPVFEEHLSVLQ